MVERGSIYDFDWSGTSEPAEPAVTEPTEPAAPTQPSTDQAVPASPEPAPPPPPKKEFRRSRNQPDLDLLPPAYRKIYEQPERKRSTGQSKGGLYDFDWGGGETTGSQYDPSSDYAITRGIKAGYTGGADAITANADMARISQLPPDQQVAEMLKPQPVDPTAAKMQVEGIQDIGGVGDVFTFVGESIGQMIGSWSAAAAYGGTTGAATGAAIGGAAGSAAAGAGALPGAGAGAVAGFGYGTIAGFVGMGTGGMWRDLLSDEGVREGLKNGTITPTEVYQWALGGGAVIGALDAIPFARRAGEVTGTKQVAADAVKARLRDVVKRGLVKGAAEEGGTEALQGAISEIGQAIAGGNADVGERVLSVVNQGLAGAFGGGPAGVVGEYAENTRRPPPPRDTSAPATPAGDTAPVAPTDGGGGSSGQGEGHGDKVPPPAGTETKTAAAPVVTTLGDGEVDPSVAATQDDAFNAEEEEGEFETRAAIAPQYEKPGAKEKVSPTVAQTDIDPTIAAATGVPPTPPAATTPAQPPPQPQQTQAAAAPPSGPLDLGNLFRTGETAYAPGAEPARPDISPIEGLPEPEAAPAPATTPAPAPVPPTVSVQPPAEPEQVELAPPDLAEQVAEQGVSRETEAGTALVPAAEAPVSVTLTPEAPRGPPMLRYARGTTEESHLQAARGAEAEREELAKARAKRPLPPPPLPKLAKLRQKILEREAKAIRLEELVTEAEDPELVGPTARRGMRMQSVRRTDLAHAVKRLAKLDDTERAYYLRFMEPEVARQVLAEEERGKRQPQKPTQRVEARPRKRFGGVAAPKQPPTPVKRAPAVSLPKAAAPKPAKPTAVAKKTVPVHAAAAQYGAASQERRAGLTKSVRDAIAAGRTVTVRDPQTRRVMGTVSQTDGTFTIAYAKGAKRKVDPDIEKQAYDEKLAELRGKLLDEAKSKLEGERTAFEAKLEKIRQASRAALNVQKRPKKGFKKGDIAKLAEARGVSMSQTEIDATRKRLKEGASIPWIKARQAQKEAQAYAEKQAAAKSAELSPEKFFQLFDVEIEGLTAETIKGQIAAAPERLQSASRRMAKHFRTSKAPVRLKSAGFRDDEIRALNAAGLATKGSFDQEQFSQWRASRIGVTVSKVKSAVALTKHPRAHEFGKGPLPHIELEGAKRAKEEKGGVQREFERGAFVLPQEELNEAAREREERQEKEEKERRAGRKGFIERHQIKRAAQKMELSDIVQPEPRISYKGRRPPQPRALREQIAVELPGRLSEKYGLGRYEPIAEAREIAKQVAFGRAMQQPSTPGELYAQIDAALKEAEEAYETARLTEKISDEFKARQAHKKASLLWDKYEAEKVRRTGKVHGMNAAALAKQSKERVRQLAREEAAKVKEGGGTAGLDKHLLQISEYYDALSNRGIGAAVKEHYRTLIDKEQAKRVKEQEKVDARLASKKKAAERIDIAEEKRLRAVEERMIERGHLTEEQVGDLEEAWQSRRASLVQHQTRQQRSRKTNRPLRDALKAAKLPTVVNGETLREWALNFIRDAERRLRANGVVVPAMAVGYGEQLKIKAAKREAPTQLRKQTVEEAKATAKAGGTKQQAMPEKPSERFNTQEENVFLFVKNLFKGRRGRAIGKGLEKMLARRKAGPALEAGTLKHRGYSLTEAYIVVDLMQRINRRLSQKAELTEDQKAELRSDIDIVNQTMFEEARTAGQSDTGSGISAREANIIRRQQQRGQSLAAPEDIQTKELAETAEEATPAEPEITEQERGNAPDTAMRAAYEAALERRGGKKFIEAPLGWETVGEFEDIPVPDSLLDQIRTIVQQVAGLNNVQWVEQIRSQYSKAWGKVVATPAGMYDPARDTITLVMSMADPGFAYHEAFHRLQDLFLTPAQKAILAAEEQSLRRIVSKMIGREQQAFTIARSEIEAEAFRAYAMGLVKVNGRMAVVWAKLKQLVRRVYNAMQGHGFQTAEDIFREAKAGRIKKQAQRPYSSAQASYIAMPFDTQQLARVVDTSWQGLQRTATTGWLKATTLKVLDTETMRRRVAELFFDGNMDNPYSRAVDAHLAHERLVEDAMREGERQDEGLHRWEAEDPQRTGQVQHAYETLLEGSIDGVDPRKPIKDDADDAHKAIHKRLKAEWDKVPADLQKLMSDRVDLMYRQMLLHDKTLARQWLQSLIDKPEGALKLPWGLSFDNAVKQLLSGKLTPGFEKALGRNAVTVKELGSLSRRTGLYVPVFRAGKYFISGRYKIAMPTVKHGKVAFDQEIMDKRGIFRFEFTDERDANEYRRKMGETGEQRVIKKQRKFIDPATGDFLPGQQKIIRDKDGKPLREAVPRYYVVMQDRFMQMSDSQADLESQLEELHASGDFEHLSKVATLEAYRGPAAATTPLALQRMLKNIDDMHTVPENASATQKEFAKRQKDIAKSMITNAFIQTQQGDRLRKRLVKRQGVWGYETSTADMYRSFHSHNEMMSRTVVSLDRIPTLRKAMEDLDRLQEALRYPEKRGDLTPEERTFVERNYGKHERSTLQLGAYVDELNNRIEGSMQSRKPGLVSGFTRIMQSLATMIYLATPAYYAIQMMGVAMQTFPRMAAKHGVGAAYRQLLAAYRDLNSGKLMGKGVAESWQEMKQFAPGTDFTSKGLFRHSHDFVENAIDNLTANEATNLDVKRKAIRKARLMNHVGQAGLDQPNQRIRQVKGKVANVALKGLEQATRIFRAMQEGIETVNRIAPICAYVDLIMEQNPSLSEDEVIQRAITAMVNEQTGYAKGNWATWASSSNPLIAFPLMFKKFAMTQAITFYESIGRALSTGSTPAERRAAIVHLALMTGMLAALGGLSGNPLWEPARIGLYLMYLLGMTPQTWDETESDGERWMSKLIGKPTAEMVMYGLPRLAGIDISGRLAMDQLLTFNQPEEFTQDEFYMLWGKIMAGAPGTAGFDALMAMNSMGSAVLDGEAPPLKSIQKLPLPKIVKDVIKAYDQSANGITTSTGVDTGTALNIGEAIATGMGFRTRTQARPFEQGSVAKQREKTRIRDERNDLIGEAVTSGMSASTMRKISSWNRDNPDQRITVKSIIESKKRRRKTEKDIRKANQGAF